MSFTGRALLALTFIFSPTLFADFEPKAEEQIFDLSGQEAFEGQIIDAIKFTGLKRTSEKAARWLLSQREGEAYNRAKWLVGIHKLYDTGALFAIVTDIKPSPLKGHVTIDIRVEDRWAIMPYGMAQAGGGASNIGGGVFDSNLFGYFAQVSVGASSFNNVMTYDLNYFQEFVADTELMLGVDISNTGTPVSLQYNGGTVAGDFTWTRQQEQLLIGRRLKPNIRLFSYIETYSDNFASRDGTPTALYSQQQYRLRPVVIFGRSELTNFLEQGQEITIAPTSANFFSGGSEYSTLVASYKRTFVHHNTNYAIWFSTGTMDSAPVPYRFHLGGYDSIRGFSTYRAIGQSYVTSTLEYRPFLTIVPAFKTSLLHWIGDTVIQGCVFQDAGNMWNANDFNNQHKTNTLGLVSQGFGVRFNFLRFTGAIARFDVARTMTPNEGWGASFGVGQFF